MGPLVSERAPTTPKHPLSNTDIKTFEKRTGRRRISLPPFSSIMVAKMHTYSGLPNGAGAFIQKKEEQDKRNVLHGQKASRSSRREWLGLGLPPKLINAVTGSSSLEERREGGWKCIRDRAPSTWRKVSGLGKEAWLPSTVLTPI